MFSFLFLVSITSTIFLPGCLSSARMTTLTLNPVMTTCNCTADCTAEHGIWAICQHEHCICSNGTTLHEKTCLSKDDEELLHIFGIEVRLSLLLIILGVIFCMLIPLALYILCTCTYCWTMVGEEIRTEEKEADARRSEELMLRIASTKTFVVSAGSSKSLLQLPSEEKIGAKKTTAAAGKVKGEEQVKIGGEQVKVKKQ